MSRLLNRAEKLTEALLVSHPCLPHTLRFSAKTSRKKGEKPCLFIKEAGNFKYPECFIGQETGRSSPVSHPSLSSTHVRFSQKVVVVVVVDIFSLQIS